MTAGFAAIADNYAQWRPPFPDALYDRLAAMGVALPSQRVLDLGAGTGIVARALICRGVRALSADVSPPLLRHAPPPRVAARGEQLPFADGTFDGVVAAQSWHWFDRRRAPAEIVRVLRLGGWVAALYQMHVPAPGTVARATEDLILRHRSNWRHANSAGVNGQVLRDMQAVGLRSIESFSFDVDLPFAAGQWVGFVSTLSVVAALPAPDRLRFESDLRRLLEAWPAPLTVTHRCFAAVAWRRGDDRL